MSRPARIRAHRHSLLRVAAASVVVAATVVASSATFAQPAPASESLARIVAREAAILDAPLSQDDAVELALLDSPLVARLATVLGIAESDRIRLPHVPSPAWEGGRALGGEETKIERPHTANLASWLAAALLPSADASAHQPAAEAIGALVFDVRRAWVTAVGAYQAVRYFEDVAEAATVARDIAERMRRVGNYSAASLVREQRFHADALAQLTRAQLAAAVERERLARLMGLWGPDIERVRLPERLPDLPPAALNPETLEGRAVAQRLDVRFARQHAPGRLEEVAVAARSETRIAWLTYRGTYELAKHARERLVPLAERASAEQLRRYNGMLASVFSLIADARDRVAATIEALDAQRDFWLAEVDLQQALAGIGGAPAARPRAPVVPGGEDAPHIH